ncbi:YcaO-like family protein [Kitasatospora sp. SUK 42]|uniref:YcaO-like family protein n=1 Tax=Kitasatospora sp. SUK 42 TaxID=1588882 RepID=UPI0018C928B6|nr:YcaO-like family protein [Kitasatospora sp. SUK 42]MBV2153696.1 YcaO-like family protein [Kitasatospora sp. SUK 42]
MPDTSRAGPSGSAGRDLEELPEELRRLDVLVSRGGGLIGQVARISQESSGLTVYNATMGELEHVQPNIRSTGGRASGVELGGGGGGIDPPLARAVSIAEALERYSSCVVPKDLVWASADDLGDRAADLASFARASETELAHPACPVTMPDREEPIRWTTAWSLTEGRPVMVPAVAVWLHIPALTASERFTLPVSTGCATHTDLNRALLNGICEVIERDAITLTWLQRLPLPRIEFDTMSDELARSIREVERKGIRTTFFDATSELGIPTLYSVDEDPQSRRLRHVAMCATDFDPDRAAIKMLRETASSRIALGTAEPAPSNVNDFHSVFHGATYMGAAERTAAYDFLREPDNGVRRFSALPRPSTGEAGEDLRLVLKRLKEHGMDVYAVEMTTTEAREVGFRVVRVIIPQLMPLSFSYRARYLAHPRLYDGPRAMGYPVHAEADLNPWPQPFA